MRVLVLGGGGMLGHKVWQTFAARFDVRVTLRGRAAAYAHLPFFDPRAVIEGVDAADFPAIEALVRHERPDAIVNCVGIIKQRDAAKSERESMTINAALPEVLARTGARVIQISTDCVFSGDRGRYRESDRPDPVDLYGRSKWMGELGAPHLTLRTSIIGRELSGAHGLVEWFLSHRGGRVKGYRHAIFSGVTTIELARTLAKILEDHRDLAGLFHVAAEPIAKYDLLGLLNAAFDARVTIEADDEPVIDRSLDGTRFREATGVVPPSWPAMVAELAVDAAAYDDWRWS